MNHPRLFLPEVFVHQYILETLPEGLPYFKEFESKLVKELMTLPMPKKKSHLPASVPYPMQFTQKRYLTSSSFQSDPKALENRIHNRLMKHNPSLLPYAREIQNDLLLFLLYMKVTRMSALGSNGTNFDGRLKNRHEIQRSFYSFLFFLRDTLTEDNPQYPTEVKEIRKNVVDALRRLGMVRSSKMVKNKKHLKVIAQWYINCQYHIYWNKFLPQLRILIHPPQSRFYNYLEFFIQFVDSIYCNMFLLGNDFIFFCNIPFMLRNWYLMHKIVQYSWNSYIGIISLIKTRLIWVLPNLCCLFEKWMNIFFKTGKSLTKYQVLS